MLSAVILAAGDSSRMGRPKALLPTPAGPPVITSIVYTLAHAGLRDIVIVTGRDHDSVVEAVRRADMPVAPRFARNADASRGQLSSLWVGMDAAVTAGTEGLLVTLVDVPLVRSATVRAVVDAWTRTRAPIVRPAIGERHGHPVIFDRRLFDELRSAPLEAGAKIVVRRHARDVVDVPVTDEGCLVDIDTPSEYEAVQRSAVADDIDD